MSDFTNTDNIIDVRDIIARVEEIRTLREELSEKSPEEHLANPFVEELQTLENLLEELKGCGGDEQWEGDWYPVTLIRDSYFEESMDEMVAECYEIPKDLPSFMTITLDYTALQMDYSSVEFDGVTYWYR